MARLQSCRRLSSGVVARITHFLVIDLTTSKAPQSKYKTSRNQRKPQCQPSPAMKSRPFGTEKFHEGLPEFSACTRIFRVNTVETYSRPGEGRGSCNRSFWSTWISLRVCTIPLGQRTSIVQGTTNSPSPNISTGSCDEQ